MKFNGFTKRRLNYGEVWMSRFIILLALIFISIQSFANELPNWPKGYEYPKVIKKASKDQTPLIIYFYTDWCSYCRRLNNEYLTTKVFKKLSSELQKLQINPEKSSKAHSLFKSKYKGTGYPTLIVTVPGISKEFIKLHPFSKQGDLTPKQYVTKMRTGISGIYNIEAFKLFEKKRYKESRQYLYKSLAYNTNDKNALVLIAKTYHQEGYEKQDSVLLKKAKVVYEKALTIYPNDTELNKNLALLGF